MLPASQDDTPMPRLLQKSCRKEFSLDQNSSSASLLSPDVTNDNSTERLLNTNVHFKRRRKFSFDQKLTDQLGNTVYSNESEQMASVEEDKQGQADKPMKERVPTCSQAHMQDAKNRDNVKLLNPFEYKNNVKAPHVTSKSVRKQRRKEIALAFGKQSIGEEGFQSCSRKQTFKNRLLSWCADTFCCCCCCKRGYTVAFDPSGRLAYWWTMVVSMAFIYNFWVLVYRLGCIKV